MPELLEARCDLEKVAVIFNPVSGPLNPVARRSRLEELARNAGLKCELGETDRDRGALPLAEEAVAQGMERLLVSGGDGSVAEAAQAAAGTPTALAVIPGGTGNLLATNLGIPSDPQEAVSLALNGEAYPTDIGRANGRAFLIMAGIGADARMIRDADRKLKNRLGIIAYFVAAWRNLRRPRTLFYVTVDGRRLRRHAHSVLIANLGRITGGMELVPDADPESGKLRVAIVRPRTLQEWLRLAGNVLMRRRQENDLIEFHRGREIIVETRRSLPVQLDGNEAGRTTRLEVRVEPGALLLVRPPEIPPPPTVIPSPEEVARGMRPWVPVLLGAAGVGLAVYLIRRRRRHSLAASPAAETESASHEKEASR